MSKLTRRQKLEIYRKKEKGETYSQLAVEYDVRVNNIKYLVSLIRIHGKKGLRANKNRLYSPELKEQIINEVLVDNQSITETALKYGLSSNGILCNWIKSYKENNNTIVEKPKGRPPIKDKEILEKKDQKKRVSNRKRVYNQQTYYLEPKKNVQKLAVETIDSKK